MSNLLIFSVLFSKNGRKKTGAGYPGENQLNRWAVMTRHADFDSSDA